MFILGLRREARGVGRDETFDRRPPRTRSVETEAALSWTARRSLAPIVHDRAAAQ